MSKPPIRVGLIGSKWVGRGHAHAFRNAGSWYDLPARITIGYTLASRRSGLMCHTWELNSLLR